MGLVGCGLGGFGDAKACPKLSRNGEMCRRTGIRRIWPRLHGMMAVAKHYLGSTYTRGKWSPKRFKKIEEFFQAPKTIQKKMSNSINAEALTRSFSLKKRSIWLARWCAIGCQTCQNRN
jgi:hypothetical protein